MKYDEICTRKRVIRGRVCCEGEDEGVVRIRKLRGSEVASES